MFAEEDAGWVFVQLVKKLSIERRKRRLVEEAGLIPFSCLVFILPGLAFLLPFLPPHDNTCSWLIYTSFWNS